jgi:hypothetical protein
MKHIYTPFLAIFLIFVIVGFSIYKQLDHTKEGLENMDTAGSNVIITRNNHKVRRRQKKPIKESYKEGASNPLKRIADGFKKIPQFFKSIGSYFSCGMDKIKSMPGCMPWYIIEVIGKFLYLPFKFIFFITKTKKIEKDLWDTMETADRFIYSIAAFHIIHYPDSIIDRCYKCRKLVPFPK